MRISIIAGAAIGVALSSPALASNAEIEQIVRSRLSDPDSARFRDHMPFRKSPQGDRVACVMVNAKNRFGGYVGFKPFLVYKTASGGRFAMDGFVNCHLSLESAP